MALPDLQVPIVLAPMAGGVGTPALCAAVSEAGGLGFLPTGYVSAERVRADLQTVRELTGAPFGVNVFVPSPPSEERLERARAYAGRLTGWASDHDAQLGEAAYTDDGYDAKLAVLLQAPPPVVSFAFGLPSAEVVGSLRDAGSAVLVTVNDPAEAHAALALGVDGLVAQGWEAGAHRGGWLDPDRGLALVPLLEAVLPLTTLPVIAAGGIASSRGVAGVLAMGAWAAMAGTAFLRCDEAGTASAHAEALTHPTPTVVTRAFTGRWARGLANAFLTTFHDVAPEGYPEVHAVTGPMRSAAREQGDADGFHLWAGQSHQLARSGPAAEVVRRLGTEVGARG